MLLRTRKEGLSLIELLVTTGIFLSVFVGILVSYVNCLELNEYSKNSSLALYALSSKLEEIKNTLPEKVKAVHDGAAFTNPALTGMGVSYIDDTNPKLLKVFLSFKQALLQRLF